MLVAEGTEHGEAGIVGDPQRRLPRVRVDKVLDVRDEGDVLEEATVRAGHVAPHLLDKVMSRRGSVFPLRLGTRVRFLAGGTVLDAEDNVEELDEATLGVATAAVLPVLLSTGSVFVEDAVR